LLARLVRSPASQGCVYADGKGDYAPVVRPMKWEKQSKHLSSHVTTEVATAKNQSAFHRQMNGG